MVNAADNILNFVIGIILIVGGIVSTLVAIYPRLSFDETSRYVEPDGNATAMSESLVQPNESKLGILEKHTIEGDAKEILQQFKK